jgi:putative phosphoesterase
MQIGIISDIHGNLEALDAILYAFKKEKVEKIICLGDMIGYFHQSIEVLDRLMDLEVSAICGNHEAYLLNYIPYSQERADIYNLEYIRKKMSRRAYEWISSLPKTLNLTINYKRMLFFHGSPWNPLEGYIYPDYQNFDDFLTIDSDYIFLGHTHHAFYKTIENKNIINPGSVGLPRDIDNKAKAVILNIEKGVELIFLHEEYDIDRFLESAQKHGVSMIAIERLKRMTERCIDYG